jgi:hypothetical protein
LHHRASPLLSLQPFLLPFCQAHHATQFNKSSGVVGEICCFRRHSTKNGDEQKTRNDERIKDDIDDGTCIATEADAGEIGSKMRYFKMHR